MDDTKKEELEAKIQELENAMSSIGFWDDKEAAQKTIQEYQDLKDELAGVGKYDKGDAIITIFGGAGGTDAEDFSRMLTEMYVKFIENQGWGYEVLHKNENDHGGFRNITFEVSGKKAYGTLKHESGVHRLVRISPFNANQKRHTSFAMVEVVPKLADVKEVEEVPESDLEIEFTKSSGPGGQNVNKRETAVRITHKPTDITVHVSSERSQEQNRTKALEMLRGKLYHRREEEQKRKEEGLSVSKTTKTEWGNQIRSYVLHPYKLVKDHRTNTEVRDVEAVFDGNLEEFIKAFE